MLTEILPYLGIPSTDTEIDTSSSNSIMIPDIRNKTIAEAQKTLEGLGLEVKVYSEGDVNNTLVSDQTPKPGSYLSKNGIKGMNASQAKSALKERKLNINIEGKGVVVSQDYMSGEQVQEGTIVNVTLRQKGGGGQ